MICVSRLLSAALCFKEQHLFLDWRPHSSAKVHTDSPMQRSAALTDWIVLEHAERAVGTRAAEGHEEACHGHRHEAHRDGS